MNFQDTWAEDAEGNRFVFTVEMKRRLTNAGLPVEPESLGELPEEIKTPQAGAAPRESGAPSGAVSIEEPESIQIDPETGKYLGKLKWYSSARGYGFISRGGGEDIFFHKTNSMGDPVDMQEGQWLLYDVEERPKGPEATEVEPYMGDLV